MVCHETFRDTKGNWLYPEDIERIDKNTALKKKDKSKVTIGSSESMSKSKKNTVDPETMIKKYGADAVRWFILSDSPPEKDVQWSDTGVISSNKFLQKIWNLNLQVKNRKDCILNKDLADKFNTEIKILVSKIDKSINEFKFNVSIALFYETYRTFNNYLNEEIDNKFLKKNLIIIMKLMIPFIPHLSNECLELLGCINKSEWPEINKDLQDEIKFAIQINGKTKDVISIKKNLDQSLVMQSILNSSKAKKYIKDKKILKTIFVKNKIINYII